jgi:hypothetical protein
MQKNKEISYSVISTIAISTLFVASFMLPPSQLSQQASAIHEGNATTTVQGQTIGDNTTTTGATSQDQTAAPDTTTAAPDTTTAAPDTTTAAPDTTTAAPDTTTAAPDTTTTQNQAAAGGSATETDATAPQTQTPTAATQEPPTNQNFVRQGTVASSPGQVAGTENLAFILPPRNDGGVYSGVLTYTASKPVEVAVIHNYDPQNSTSVPEEYGAEFTSPLPDGTGNIAITLFQPQYLGDVSAASVPFTGNALALHTAEEGPFTATYTVNAFATQPENANAPLEFTSAEGEVEEDTAGDQDTTEDQGQDTTEDQGQDTTEDQGQDTTEDQGQDTTEDQGQDNQGD